MLGRPLFACLLLRKGRDNGRLKLETVGLTASAFSRVLIACVEIRGRSAPPNTDIGLMKGCHTGSLRKVVAPVNNATLK